MLGGRICKLTGITSSDTQDDLTNVDSGDGSVGLSPSTTHSSLKPIGTGARQHLVDTDDVVWVSADTKMETFLSGNLYQVPVKSVLAPPLEIQHFVVVLTCWRKYGQLPKPQSSIVRIRWRPCGCREETRRRSHAFGQGRRFGSLGQVHHG